MAVHRYMRTSVCSLPHLVWILFRTGPYRFCLLPHPQGLDGGLSQTGAQERILDVVIRPVGSAVPTPVCKLGYGSDNTACHKLWLWHPASYLSALQVSASRIALPSGPPMPATEGSPLQVPTDPGGATHPICNRGQTLRDAHLPHAHGIHRCLCRHRDWHQG